MIISFSQLVRNILAGSEILLRIMLKCQRKNYPHLLEKLSCTAKWQNSDIKFSDVSLDEFSICI